MYGDGQLFAHPPYIVKSALVVLLKEHSCAIPGLWTEIYMPLGTRSRRPGFSLSITCALFTNICHEVASPLCWGRSWRTAPAGKSDFGGLSPWLSAVYEQEAAFEDRRQLLTLLMAVPEADQIAE